MKFRVKGKKKRMTEETNVAGAEAPVIETETVRTPDGKEVKIPVQDYRVKVTTHFTLKAPIVTGEEAFKALSHLVWENMPAGNIGENFFVQFPRGFKDLNVQVDVEKLADVEQREAEVVEMLSNLEAEEVKAEVVEEAAQPAEGTNG